jgi:hypothetical protein
MMIVRFLIQELKLTPLKFAPLKGWKERERASDSIDDDGHKTLYVERQHLYATI